jgi:O-methyltransferase domain
MAQTPFDTINDISCGHVVARCLNAVTEASIADALGDAPQSPEDLAAAAGTHAGALNRMLRLLSSYGIFEGRDGRYSHTPASRLLRKDHPQSLRSYVLMVNLPVCWDSAEAFGHSLRTGQPAIDKFFPDGFWSYLATHPDEGRIFNEAMGSKAHGQIAGVIAGYDFSRFGTIADIGGGHGHLLRAVLSAAPKAKGILFDQPNVIREAAALGSDRLTLQGGDFFKDSMPVADAYLLMQVTHDWDDAQATAILSGIRRAAPSHAKILQVEAVIPDTPGPDWAKMVDLFMLALLSGRERTRSEYQKLLAGAGFRLDRVIDVGQSTAILESVPA